MRLLKVLPASLLFCLLSANGQSIDDLVNVLKHAATTPPSLKVLDKYAASHATTHRIQLETTLNETYCSSTAIGPHALITANHCELGTDQLTVDGKKAVIVSVLRDNNEHTIYLLDGVTFKTVASVDQTPPLVGEEVYMFGNPVQKHDLMRKGFVSGLNIDKEGVTEVFDLNVGSGDSGAGVFNPKGKLIAVISESDDAKDTGGFRMAYSFAIAFTELQLEKARTF